MRDMTNADGLKSSETEITVAKNEKMAKQQYDSSNTYQHKKGKGKVIDSPNSPGGLQIPRKQW
ncbi:82_t:CDS:2, partial [Ambispora gerdemannii]